MLRIEPPDGITPRGRILCIQPFSEEANLSRRVLVAAAAEMALQGWVVSIPDLFGMGDSDGESEDIALATWRADLTRLALREAGVSQPAVDPAVGRGHDALPGDASADRLVVWGIRMGCVLTVDLLARSGADGDALVLWQPVMPSVGSAGRLRVPLATSKPAPDLDEADRVERVEEERPADDGVAVVNGYRYRQSFLDELAALGSGPPPGQDHAGRPVTILHMGRLLAPDAAEPPRLPPAVPRLAEQWRASNARVELSPIRAEPFWTSIEPVMPQAAIATTLTFLDGL